ncbi:type VI secretion system ATPase TssH [Nannocystis sp. SCPEA4]|uniref:type VI secretion system ATPase TssH n=1 Tax=Nannocystis sp. SCPEA4 TaxID=2996787 RepID=UPI00226F3EA0|nr:type VI secretion system ATPase TssH [Nannocystis sp. SCPEA4]MCY1059900.1 type VI secretion system ATPase TssH [Nannocystis sp. SCPEA4]
MRVDPKAIVRRLNPTCTSMLEAAVSHAASSRYYEIVPEHLLAAILNGEDTDAAKILSHFNQDATRLRQRVQRVLETMRTGNAGRPVFAETLFQWLEDAWVVASLQYGATEIRTGHLIQQWCARGHRYSAETLAELAAIDLETLRKDLEGITAGSKEAVRAATAPAGGTGGGTAAATPVGAGEQALRRFTSSYTEKAREGKIDPVFGRHQEIRQLVEILIRRRKNNPIIVGEPGVGKTALVEGLARAIVEGDVPTALQGVELLELDMGLMQAGAGVRGEFEKRLKAVIEEVKSSPKPIVLFIDEAHTIVGNKDNDATNILKPALARGELRTIAATTWSEYKKYFEKDAAFARRFQLVKVDEPSEEQALVMLRGLRDTYERTHSVTIRDEALIAAAKLSHRYISGRQLPDKAVDLLDTASTRVKIEQASRPEAMLRQEQELAALKREIGALEREDREGNLVDLARLAELRDKLRAGEDEKAALEKRWQDEKEALAAVDKAREALRTAGDAATDELREAKRNADAALISAGGEERLIHAEVDSDAVARVVSNWTGIPVGNMKRDAMESLLRLEDTLTERVKGQPNAVKVVSETLRIAHAGIRNPSTPIGVLLFVGTSGVGKTETATALADLLYGGERFMTTINMSEFQEKHTVSRLIGSPPGYVGYGEGGVLTEAVRQRPYSVVLLDECEKADLDVMNLFYQVFDKGMLSDGEGRLIDFKNTIVILTSNLASDAIMKLTDNGLTARSPEELVEAIRPTLSKHFKPALLARMSIVPFQPLPPAVLREITELKLKGLRRRLFDSHKIATEVLSEVYDAMAARCNEAETGARNVDHILRGSLMPVLSRKLLETFAAGQQPSKVRIGLGKEGEAWDITFDPLPE